MSGTHAILAYSSADRWTRCSGSPAVCRNIPDKANEAAALGTAKHEAQYWCLMHTTIGKTADELLGRPWSADGFAGNFTDEDIGHINATLAMIRAVPGQYRWYELEVRDVAYLGLTDPDKQGGTADAIHEDREARVLHVGDSKFGYGLVDVELNRQMMGYGRSALEKFDEFGVHYDEVHLHVFQPKRSLDTQTYKMTVAELRHLTDEWAAPAQMAMDAWYGRTPPHLNPGDIQCEWCPARASCKARQEQILNQFPVETNPHETSDTELSEALGRIDAIEAWCRDLRAEALQRALAGRTLPGFKLIEGKRGNRRWVDPSIARLVLEGMGISADETPKLVSPTEAERRLKKAGQPYTEVSMIVEQPPGAPSLARWAEAGEALPVQEFGLEEAS